MTRDAICTDGEADAVVAAESAEDVGTVLACTNPECPCRLRIQEPCPHGGTYTCACGHALEPEPSPLADVPG